jgi:hypothetical protein
MRLSLKLSQVAAFMGRLSLQAKAVPLNSERRQ